MSIGENDLSGRSIQRLKRTRIFVFFLLVLSFLIFLNFFLPYFF